MVSNIFFISPTNYGELKSVLIGQAYVCKKLARVKPNLIIEGKLHKLLYPYVLPQSKCRDLR